MSVAPIISAASSRLLGCKWITRRRRNLSNFYSNIRIFLSWWLYLSLAYFKWRKKEGNGKRKKKSERREHLQLTRQARELQKGPKKKGRKIMQDWECRARQRRSWTRWRRWAYQIAGMGGKNMSSSVTFWAIEDDDDNCEIEIELRYLKGSDSIEPNHFTKPTNCRC